VVGNVAPDTLKLLPDCTTVLIVTGAVPEDVRVKDLVAVVFTTTDPNATLVALMLSVAVGAFNCMAKLFETPPWLAVRVTA
jgi:hypothetical protein